MKNLFISTCFTCILFICTSQLAYSDQVSDSYSEALKAYEANDYKSAFESLQKLANNGHSESQFYRSGLGVRKNSETCARWFLKAAKGGNVNAQFSIGVLYSLGTGVKKDGQKALAWFEKAAQQGHVKAQLSVGNAYFEGKDIPQNYSKAAFWFHKAAEKDERDAYASLGELYEKGLGVEQNIDKALKLYKNAADRGNLKAQLALVSIFETGDEKYPPHYVYWLKKAAHQGDTNSLYNLAMLYYDGKYIDKDLFKVEEFLMSASSKGHELATFKLALFSINGDFGADSQERGVKSMQFLVWYHNRYAEDYVGQKFFKGDGVPKDYSKAFDLFTRSAMQGYNQGQFHLALMYTKDSQFRLALLWFEVARLNGFEYGQAGINDVLPKVVEELSQDRKSVVNNYQAAARRCIKTNYKDCQF